MQKKIRFLFGFSSSADSGARWWLSEASPRCTDFVFLQPQPAGVMCHHPHCEKLDDSGDSWVSDGEKGPRSPNGTPNSLIEKEQKKNQRGKKKKKNQFNPMLQLSGGGNLKATHEWMLFEEGHASITKTIIDASWFQDIIWKLTALMNESIKFESIIQSPACVRGTTEGVLSCVINV